MTALQATAATWGDSLRTTLDSVFASPAYRWETRGDPFGALRRLWLATGEYLAQLRDGNPAAFRALTWLLVTVLVAIVAHAAWVAVRTMRGGVRQMQSGPGGSLPAPRDAAWYAGEAARLAAQGDFVTAMQADFLRLVLELEARRLLAFHPSKTPSEYTRAAALGAEGRRALAELVRDMYGHAFAGVPCDRAGYDAWRERTIADRYAPAY